MGTVNAWAVEVLDGDLGGYRFANIMKTEDAAIKLAQEIDGRVVPLEDFDWRDRELPF